MSEKTNVLLLSVFCSTLLATNAHAEISMAEANQAINNPITSFTLFITENDTTSLNGGLSNKSRYSNSTLIEPVVPIEIGDSGYNLVNRPVIQVVSTTPIPSPTAENSNNFESKSGLGDTVFFSLLKPPSTGYFQWAVGPTTMWPTASDNLLGSQKFSAGPAAIALYTSPKWTFGALAQQWWSYAGKSEREDVSQMDFQYFITYQFNDRWSFITAPVITADWKADSRNKWSVPISTGISYSFMVGKAHTRVLLEPQYYVVQADDFGPRWNVRLAFAVILPKI